MRFASSSLVPEVFPKAPLDMGKRLLLVSGSPSQAESLRGQTDIRTSVNRNSEIEIASSALFIEFRR